MELVKRVKFREISESEQYWNLKITIRPLKPTVIFLGGSITRLINTNVHRDTSAQFREQIKTGIRRLCMPCKHSLNI